MAEFAISGKLALTLVLLTSFVIVLSFILIKASIQFWKKSKLDERAQTSLSYIINRTKYKKFDVFQHFKTFFLVGMVVSLSAVLFAFNWTTERHQDYHEDYLVDVFVPLEVIPERTSFPKPPPPPPPAPPEELVPLEKDMIIKEPELIETDLKIDQQPFVERPIISTTVDHKVEKKIPLPLPERVEDEPPVRLVAEQMPRFPGCEDLATEEEKKSCAQSELLKYIYKNLKYPEFARQNGIEGMAVIQFVVDTDGSITKIKKARDIGGGCGDAAVAAVKSMNVMEERWIPGKQNGRPVKVLFTLPVRFDLKD